ncbi:MAG: DUF167 domain-containing protein [Microbacteriaceae bacterium]|nr:DUF167 domain-containing protein [Microbacteriaceae bacterium]
MLVEVRVKPGSSKGPLIERDGEVFTVYIRERAVDGAANSALIKLLADYFEVPKSSVSIKRGHKGRTKILELDL